MRAISLRRSAAVGTPALVLAVTLCGLAWPPAASSDTPATRAATTAPAAAPAAPPAVGPIAYYVASCARCHGDISAAYVGLEHPKRGKVLQQVIDDMATGPAQAPLDPEGLKQQTALHEAMFGKTPFVWLDPGPSDRVSGEVLPGTTLTFEAPGGPAARPPVTDNRFDFPKRPGTLFARCGEAVVKIAVR